MEKFNLDALPMACYAITGRPVKNEPGLLNDLANLFSAWTEVNGTNECSLGIFFQSINKNRFLLETRQKKRMQIAATMNGEWCGYYIGEICTQYLTAYLNQEKGSYSTDENFVTFYDKDGRIIDQISW